MKKLSRNELKHITGGVYADGSGSSCGVQWYPGHGGGSFDFSNSPNEVTLTIDRVNGTSTFRGLTYDQAQSLLSNGGRWCCASCSSSSWY